MNIQKSISSRVRPALRHACIFVALCASAQAVIIQPNTAVASSQFGTNYVATNTINGSGLTGAVGTLPTHAPYTTASGGNHWTTARNTDPHDAHITWGFSAPQTLDTIYIWNHQSDNGFANHPGYDVGSFALTFYDSGSNVIGNYSGVLAFDSNAAQSFAFPALSGISSVRFDVNSVQDPQNYTGLAEVAFNTTTITSNGVPDGGVSALLLAAGLLGLGLFSRRIALA